MKGGHSTNQQAADYVLMEDLFELLAKCTTNCNENTHGTGDTFQRVSRRISKRYAVRSGDCDWQTVYTRAISQAISVGHGHGPTNHWAQLTQDIQVIKA